MENARFNTLRGFISGNVSQIDPQCAGTSTAFAKWSALPLSFKSPRSPTDTEALLTSCYSPVFAPDPLSPSLSSPSFSCPAVSLVSKLRPLLVRVPFSTYQGLLIYEHHITFTSDKY